MLTNTIDYHDRYFFMQLETNHANVLKVITSTGISNSHVIYDHAYNNQTCSFMITTAEIIITAGKDLYFWKVILNLESSFKRGLDQDFIA